MSKTKKRVINGKVEYLKHCGCPKLERVMIRRAYKPRNITKCLKCNRKATYRMEK